MRWLLLVGVWGLYASFGLVASCLAPLVPLVEHELGISHAAMGSVLGAWQLVYMFAAIPCGILLDRLGSRWAIAIGNALIAISALARSVADDLTTLLLSVMIFGLGGPLISAGSPKVVTEWFRGSSRGLAMGIYATGPAVGGAVTLTLTHSWLLPWLGDWRELRRADRGRDRAARPGCPLRPVRWIRAGTRVAHADRARRPGGYRAAESCIDHG